MWICLQIYIYILCSVHKHLYCSQIYVIACANKYMHMNIYIYSYKTHIYTYMVYIYCVYIYILYMLYTYILMYSSLLFWTTITFIRGLGQILFEDDGLSEGARERDTHIYIYIYIHILYIRTRTSLFMEVKHDLHFLIDLSSWCDATLSWNPTWTANSV